MTIGKINTMMSDRGFPLVNLETAIKNTENESAEVSMMSSKSGSNLVESPIDILQRNANADIIIQLTYVINQEGPCRSITFMLQGLDAYTKSRLPAHKALANLRLRPKHRYYWKKRFWRTSMILIQDFRPTLTIYLPTAEKLFFRLEYLMALQPIWRKYLPIKMNRLNWEKSLRIG